MRFLIESQYSTVAPSQAIAPNLGQNYDLAFGAWLLWLLFWAASWRSKRAPWSMTTHFMFTFASSPHFSERSKRFGV